MTSKPWSPENKATLDLVEDLREKFQIPPHVISFSIHFDGQDCVIVDCSYYPEFKNGS